VQLCFVRVIKHEFVIVLYEYVVTTVRKFGVGFLQAKQLTNGDQCKVKQ